MYSNIYIYAFFTILLCFAPLISADGSKLRPHYYNTTCTSLMDKVLWGVGNATEAHPVLRTSLIRMHFHDCLVNGCDASLLIDDTTKVRGEKSSLLNKNILLLAYKVIDDIKKDVEASCPQTVSCADILTLVATASIRLAFPKPHEDDCGHDTHEHDHMNDKKRKPFGIQLGRLDGLVANKKGADKDLPSSQDSINTLIAKFDAQGLSPKDLVVLSGAYKICSPISGTNKFSVTNILTPLDWNSNNETAQLVKFYNANPKTFFKDIWDSMVKISTTDVITTGDPRIGEIRKECGSRNSK